MAGYTINDLKKASSINPLDKLPIQQSGVTRQIEAGMLDNATIINSGDNTGVIREAKTFIIENNSTSLQITLGDAVGRIVSDNEFTDSPEAAKGWVITVINNSTRNHALFHGNYSETLAPGDVIHYYWNGARWTVHSLAVDRLTVIGNANFSGQVSGSGFSSGVNGLIDTALYPVKDKLSVCSLSNLVSTTSGKFKKITFEVSRAYSTSIILLSVRGGGTVIFSICRNDAGTDSANVRTIIKDNGAYSSEFFYKKVGMGGIEVYCRTTAYSNLVNWSILSNAGYTSVKVGDAIDTLPSDKVSF